MSKRFVQTCDVCGKEIESVEFTISYLTDSRCGIITTKKVVNLELCKDCGQPIIDSIKEKRGEK